MVSIFQEIGNGVVWSKTGTSDETTSDEVLDDTTVLSDKTTEEEILFNDKINTRSYEFNHSSFFVS